MPFVEIAIGLIKAVGLMALTAVVYGMLLRSPLSKTGKSIATGFIFGAGAVVAMLSPVHLGPGSFVDGRSIFVGLGAAFGGAPAAIIGVAMAAGFRLYAGGAGAVSGSVGIVLAAFLGLVWAWTCPCKGRPEARHLVIAGAMISLQFLAIYLFVRPVEIANHMMLTVYPMLLGSSIASALVLGMLVERERKLIDSETSLKRAAEMDFLTALMNRRAFHMAATALQDHAFAREQVHTVAILDIDHFKQINDRWGHEAGDKALAAFAGVLKSNCRGDDMVARLGGEEFIILFRNTRVGDAMKAIDRILNVTRATRIETPSGNFGLTVSAGLSEFRPRSMPLDEVIADADSALYAAKNGGRDRVELGHHRLVA